MAAGGCAETAYPSVTNAADAKAAAVSTRDSCGRITALFLYDFIVSIARPAISRRNDLRASASPQAFVLLAASPMILCFDER